MKQVKDYIHHDISSVNENSDIRRVIRTMKLNRTTTLPVVNSLGHIVGCISERDILKASMPDYMKGIYNTSFMANIDQITLQLKEILHHKATEYIDRSFPSVKPDDSMSFAADLLYRSQRMAIPVVENKLLIGFISRIDILIASADNGDEMKASQ